VQAALHSRATDHDVRSFGSIYGLQPDAESEAIRQGTNPTVATTPTNVVVQFDAALQDKESNDMKDDQSFDASSAGFTTGSTRSKLREQEKINETLRNQMIALNEINQQKNDDDSNQTAKTTQSTQHQLAVALAALQLLQEQQAIVTNPPSATLITDMEVDPNNTTNTAPALATPTDIEPGDVGRQF
jgi:hypothetical protein